jgi:hypothetical protein
MGAVTFYNPRTNKASWVLTETADKLRAMTDAELRAYRFGPTCAAFRNIRLAADMELQRRGSRA